MAQSWVENIYTQGTVADTTLSNMELMLESLRSSFSGEATPSSAVRGQLWFDTSNTIMRYRNAALDGFPGLMSGDIDQKIWIYRNDTLEGWTIDDTVTDCVLSLIGGDNAYSTSGGSTAGTWTQPVHDHSVSATHVHGIGNHTHKLFKENPSHPDVGSTRITTIQGGERPTFNDYSFSCWASDGQTERSLIRDIDDYIRNKTYATSDNAFYVRNPSGTTNTAATASGTTDTDSTASTWRPAAACGTLQYINITLSGG